MANVIELKSGEHPPTGERHALIVSSSSPPATGVPILDRAGSRTFFANLDEPDIATVMTRARSWADAKRISRIYVRRLR